MGDLLGSLVRGEQKSGQYCVIGGGSLYYQLPKKFKVPQIMSYTGDEDPLDHLENFQAHLDLHGTSDEVACRAFPLTLSRNAQD
jgi:hypothetical protein